MHIHSIRKAKHLTGKKILLRVDFNVPFFKGEIKDDFKIRANLLTILFLLRQKCQIIICSHITETHTLRLVALRLQKILNEEHNSLFNGKVTFLNDCCGFKVEEELTKMQNGDIVILENLRKYPEETTNDSNFARRLARLADIYVNNAFAVSHRTHASVSAIQKYLPSYAGLLLEREVGSLHKLTQPKKPFVVVMGGIKLETKLPLILKFYKQADHILLGGGVANSFLKFLGNETGISEISESDAKLLKKQIRESHKIKILTPIDVIIKTYDKHKGEEIARKTISEIKGYDKILDIGPETIKLYSSIIKNAKTIVWNGPMGKFEDPKFKHGTLSIAKAIAARSNGPAFGVIGGGETIEAMHMTEMSEFVDWISTGGGAMLSYLSGATMPGFKTIIK